MKSISKWLILCFISFTIFSCSEDDAFVFVPGSYSLETFNYFISETRVITNSEIIRSISASMTEGEVVVDFDENGIYTITGNATFTNTLNVTNEDPETEIIEESFDVSGNYSVNELENTFTLNNFFDVPSENQEMTVTSFSDNQFTVELSLNITNDSGEIRQEVFQVEMTFSRR